MNKSEKTVRTRFAPSPTGYLHIGGLRTALYNFLFAKKNKGVFILRIEDTDKTRFVEGALESLMKSLKWADLGWEEGPVLKDQEIDLTSKVVPSSAYPGVMQIGEYGPYIQSERLDQYRKYTEQLIQKQQAYPCFCTPERLAEMREQQQKNEKPPMYDKHCLKLSKEEVRDNLNKKIPYVVRLNVPENEIVEFEDFVRGKISFNSNSIDDQILLKSDGFPTYHLANVVDDHLMKISHVIRGEEWLPSTPKHILLYKAFNWDIPSFGHLPLLLTIDKKKLSKRDGDVAVEDYIKKGYLKEALINFVALLGWNPGEGSTKEIFSLQELIKDFDLHKVHKAGAVFDVKKLDWINSQYLKKLSIDEFYEQCLPYLETKEFFITAPEERKTKKYLKKVISIERERLSTLAAIGDENPYFFQDISYDKELLRWKKLENEELKKSLEISRNVLAQIPAEQWNREFLEKKLLETAGEKRGDLLWPLRATLTGAQKSPSPFEIAWVLGKAETLKRINEGIEKI